MRSFWKKIGLVFVGISGLVIILGVAGFFYLRSSDWWIAFTLFSDDTRVENFRNFHTLFPSEPVLPGEDVWTFVPRPQELPLSYTFAGEKRRIDDYLQESWTTGIAVAKDENLLVEQYFLGYGPDSLVTSFSVAKSVVSALVGIALQEGHIESVHDTVETYVPELTGTGYGSITLHHLLTMSSGVDFDENYHRMTSDINMLSVHVFGFQTSLADLLKDVSILREPGTYNEYLSSDTIVLGMVLQAATGTSLSKYLERTIWQPAGMQYPAYWNTDYHGNTLAHAFLSASLLDFLRFGRLYLNQGYRNGLEIIPSQWVDCSVNPTESRLQPGENPDSHWTFGYGYQWWIPEDPQGDFVAIGIWGQYVYVHPAYGVVIAKTSADYDFDVRDHETIEIFRTIARWADSL